MDLEFDPYQAWLQIATDRRPPSHYDLLGLAPFESSIAKIEAAHEERYAHVRKYQLTDHGEVAVRVMNELSRAKLCLTDAEKKQQYDQQLRRQQPGLAPPEPQAADEPPVVAPVPVAPVPVAPVPVAPVPVAPVPVAPVPVAPVPVAPVPVAPPPTPRPYAPPPVAQPPPPPPVTAPAPIQPPPGGGVRDTAAAVNEPYRPLARKRRPGRRTASQLVVDLVRSSDRVLGDIAGGENGLLHDFLRGASVVTALVVAVGLVIFAGWSVVRVLRPPTLPPVFADGTTPDSNADPSPDDPSPGISSPAAGGSDSGVPKAGSAAPSDNPPANVPDASSPSPAAGGDVGNGTAPAARPTSSPPAPANPRPSVPAPAPRVVSPAVKMDRNDLLLAVPEVDDTDSNTPLQLWGTVHDSPITSVAVSVQSDVLASGDADGVVRLWGLKSGGPLNIEQRPARPVLRVALLNDRSLVSIHDDGEVRLWPGSGGRRLSILLKGGERPVDAAIVSGAVARVDARGIIDIHLLDRRRGVYQARALSQLRTEAPTQLATFCGTHALMLSVDTTGALAYWNVRSRRPLQRTLYESQSAITQLASYNGPRALILEGDRRVAIWDVILGQELFRFDSRAAVRQMIARNSVVMILDADGILWHWKPVVAVGSHKSSETPSTISHLAELPDTARTFAMAVFGDVFFGTSDGRLGQVKLRP